jgi:large subunit ribosomal protein L9
MFEDERQDTGGFTEAVDPTLEPGEIPAELLDRDRSDDDA